jgi:hypothetical protein
LQYALLALVSALSIFPATAQRERVGGYTLASETLENRDQSSMAAMSKSSKLTAVLAAASVAIPAGAWRVDLPQPTEVLASSLVLEGWSPKPTSPPELRRMLRRQSNDDDEDDDESMLVAPDATCGYISGLEGAHYTCVGDFSCVMYTASSTSSGNVACCNDRNCNLRVTCINYEEFYSSSACNDACRVDGFTVKWYVYEIVSDTFDRG